MMYIDWTKLVRYVYILAALVINFTPAVANPIWTPLIRFPCHANWDEANKICPKDLWAPSGFQACRLHYYVGHQDGRSRVYNILPLGVFPGDTESPPRFLGYHVELFANGGHRIFDRWGSKIELYNLGMSYVPATLTNEQKFQEGCDLSQLQFHVQLHGLTKK